MTALCLIADDLTGALDSACAFATPCKPIIVPLPGKPFPQSHALAINTQTRDISEDKARQITGEMFQHHANLLQTSESPLIWFKKIDSVMRGHPFAEMQVILTLGSFDHCVFAPAYPQMGRISKNGQQYRISNKQALPVGRNFSDITQETGHPISVIDASSQEALQRQITAILSRIRGKILWVGTGGLAHALCTNRGFIDFAPVVGMIIGTRHPVSIKQLHQARKAGAIMIKRDDVPPATSLPQHPWIWAPALQESTAKAVNNCLMRHAGSFDISNPQHSSLIVTGGATLSLLLKATQANYLECLGEATTGVAVSRIKGGKWHGITLLSKSGGFGINNLLSSLVGI